MSKHQRSATRPDGQSDQMSHTPWYCVSQRVRLWCFRALGFVLVIISAAFMWDAYLDTGLFIDAGVDYGMYLAQATVFAEGHPDHIYDKAKIDEVYKRLLTLYAWDKSLRTNDPEIWAVAVPYPPLFAWAMQLFTLPSPPTSLFLWTVLSIALTFLLGWRIAGLCPRFDKLCTTLLFVGSFPVVLNLHVGQIQIFLAWAVMECYVALRQGKDLQAGLWLGCLLIKPHYGILLGPLLIWKQRWMAVLGVAIIGGIIMTGSILTAGLETLMRYPNAFTDMAKFRGDDPAVMINWRSLLLDIRPEIYWRTGIVVTMVLGLFTVIGIGWIWRGPWRAQEQSFSSKFLLTLLATLLVTYHSHPYGAAIIAAPLAAVVCIDGTSRFFTWIVMSAAALPTLIFTFGYPATLSDELIYTRLVPASQMLKMLLLLLFMSLLAEAGMNNRQWKKSFSLMRQGGTIDRMTRSYRQTNL